MQLRREHTPLACGLRRLAANLSHHFSSLESDWNMV